MPFFPPIFKITSQNWDIRVIKIAGDEVTSDVSKLSTTMLGIKPGAKNNRICRTMAAHSFNLSEFGASLVYRVNSKTVRVTQRNPDLKNKQKEY